ncbi:response regulator transcription factor [bacterium]|nr:response regulator transcription factor [bacterium]
MNKITLYIVDEYVLGREALKKQFQADRNFSVLGDYNFIRQCLKSMSNRPADVVLADIGIDYKSSFEAFDFIKSHFPKTKIIVLSSLDEKEKVLASLSCGVCGYVLKENAASIKHVVKTVIDGGFWMDLEIARYAFSSINVKDQDNQARLQSSLTTREMEVLKLVCEGKTNSQIAQEIIVSTNTAKAHVGSILAKLSAKDRVEAAVIATRANLFQRA